MEEKTKVMSNDSLMEVKDHNGVMETLKILLRKRKSLIFTQNKIKIQKMDPLATDVGTLLTK